VTRIARLEGAKTRLQRRLYFCGDYTGTNSSDAKRLVWREIDTAFENCILTGAVINVEYIKSRQFLEDVGCAVLERARDVIERHNGEFVAGDNRANKSINTKNYEIFQISNLCEWYERQVIESTLAALEFHERDSEFSILR